MMKTLERDYEPISVDVEGCWPTCFGMSDHRKRRPSKPTKRARQHLCLDKGYDYAVPRDLAEERSFTLHLRRRGEEIHAKRHRGAKARRWVVERAHAWLNRFRGVLNRWPKKPENYRVLIRYYLG